MQTALRAELAALPGDPSYEQFTAGLPYLDAVVNEILRLHPPIEMTTRMAAVGDVIPLSTPITLPDGRTTDRVAVAAGQFVLVPISAMNRMEALWGADAKQFVPERWLEEKGLPAGVRDIQGHRHLLTFMDGPRMCLGRGFAVAEFKVRFVPAEVATED